MNASGDGIGATGGEMGVLQIGCTVGLDAGNGANAGATSACGSRPPHCGQHRQIQGCIVILSEAGPALLAVAVIGFAALVAR